MTDAELLAIIPPVQDDALVGRWQLTGINFEYYFEADGTGSIHHSDFGLMLHFIWGTNAGRLYLLHVSHSMDGGKRVLRMGGAYFPLVWI